MLTLGHKDGSIERMSNSRITQIVKGMPTHTIIGGEFAVVKDADNFEVVELVGEKTKELEKDVGKTLKKAQEDLKKKIKNIE